MNYVITIGSYRMPDFVRLNIEMCNQIFGDSAIITVSDDESPESSRIKQVAGDCGASYMCNGRRRHFSGDVQASINALACGQECGADVAIKISQRLIPVLPRFKEIFDTAFSDTAIDVLVPGRPSMKCIARPMAKFYTNFGILTDVIGMRIGKVDPSMVAQVYRERVGMGERGASLVEVMWGWILKDKFHGRHLVCDELANHKPFEPKIYLRKSQSIQAEYDKLAQSMGFSGDFDLREWGAIEAGSYVPTPNLV